jgi:hypothetical protein
MAQSRVLQPVRSASRSLLAGSGRPVLIGTGIAFIACTTVAAAVLLFSSASAGPEPALETPAAAAVPSAPVVVASQRQAVVADRWYEDTATAAIAKPILSAPVRDSWYVDHSAARSVPAPVSSLPRVADRWYEDATTATTVKPALSTPAARDAWYLDRDASQTAPTHVSAIPRVADRWYDDSTGQIGGQLAPTIDTSSEQRNLVLDRWYLDPAFRGEDQTVSEHR